MDMDVKRVAVGVILLLVSSVVIMAAGNPGTAVPLGLTAVAALGLAAGSLLVGTSGSGRPV